MMNYSETPTDHYDFAIVGAGLSGLMLTGALLENAATASKRILLLDRSFTDYPPKTWCFWEKGEGRHQSFVEKEWQAAEFFEGARKLTINLQPYKYKMISGQRFCEEMVEWIARHKNVTMRQASVESLHAMRDFVWVNTSFDNYTASMVFDSRYDWTALENHKGLVLYQQFVGWFIHTEASAFDPHVARLMDFRVEQKDAVAFCYLLPIDEHNALVEYTLFTSKLQPQQLFETALTDYLDAHYPGGHFHVKSREKGIIPMTDAAPVQPHPRVIPIGMAGGCTKPSSGYTFLFARQHTDAIISALNAGQTPGTFRPPSQRFDFYDRVFLRVLSKHPERGAGILFDMFRKNLPEKILDFMGNGSSPRDEAAIFTRMPWGLFVQAAMREITRAW